MFDPRRLDCIDAANASDDPRAVGNRDARSVAPVLTAIARLSGIGSGPRYLGAEVARGDRRAAPLLRGVRSVCALTYRLIFLPR
jgi:hypothetical protein